MLFPSTLEGQPVKNQGNGDDGSLLLLFLWNSLRTLYICYMAPALEQYSGRSNHSLGAAGLLYLWNRCCAVIV